MDGYYFQAALLISIAAKIICLVRMQAYILNKQNSLRSLTFLLKTEN